MSRSLSDREIIAYNYLVKEGVRRGMSIPVAQRYLQEQQDLTCMPYDGLAKTMLTANDFGNMLKDMDRAGILNGSAEEMMYGKRPGFEYMGDIKQMMLRDIERMTAEAFGGYPEGKNTNKGSEALRAAKEAIKEMEQILENIKKEPLISYTIDRMSKDKKHAYVKKGDTDLRIMAVDKLELGDEVLLHPKTFQIVERVGKPPLEISRFSPDTIPNVKWEDIGGLMEAKADLIEAIEMPHANVELFRYYNKKPIKGILLSGPPGCGKTMLGKACATALARIYGKENSRTGFLYVKGPEILNQYVGQTEQTIRDMFWDAKRHKEEHGYPAVIFLDEADAILAARGTRNVGIGNTIVPMFLTEMDGLEESSAIVIIATNRPDVLDPAIVRDGRVDRKIQVTRPNEESAADILKLSLNGVPLAKGVDVDTIVESMVETIYSPDCQVARGVLLRHIVNGAMLSNCVSLAVSQAIVRDIGAKKKTGITLDDTKYAILRIQRMSASVRHDLEMEV